MKTAVMADIHGNHIALEACIDEAKRHVAEEFLTLPYDVDRAIQEMDAEHLSEQAPGWYRITKQALKGGSVTHLTVLTRTAELCQQDTGIQNWRNILENTGKQRLTNSMRLKEAKHV